MPNFMGQNVPVGPYAGDQLEIQRKQRLAQLLQQQAMDPLQAPQGGRLAAPISPLAVGGKLAQAYMGQKREKEAGEQTRSLTERMQSERQAALAKALSQAGGSPQPDAALGGGPAMPPDPVGAMGTLAQSQDPSVMQMGAPPINMQMAQQKQQQEQAFRQQQAQAAQEERVQRDAAARQQQTDMARLTASLRPDPNRPPAGYRPSATGDLEAIPGGPADMKQRGQFNQDTGILQASTSGLDRLGAEANSLLKHPGLSKSTGVMSIVPGVGGLASIPGTDAANFKARLDTLKSQVGFSVLQDMRNNSKTGGALGQVSDRENVMLQNNLAALDRAQSEPEFKAALQRIVDYTEAAKDRLRGAFNLKHGDVQDQGVPQRRSTDKPAGKFSDPEKERRYQEWKRKQGK